MADSDTAAAGSAKTSLLEQVSKAAAVFGALIAVGQASTGWISGYWNAEAEREKGRRQVELAELKSRSELAESYIKLIIAKDTVQADRVMLLGALSQLRDHPLQRWAQARHKAIQDSIEALEKAYAAQVDANEIKSDAERRQAALTAEIQRLVAEKQYHRENIERTNDLQKQIQERSVELLAIRATIGVQTARAESGATVISRVAAGVTAPPTPNLGDAITLLTAKVNVDLLMVVFPEKARASIQANVGFLAAAMKEFQVSDPRLAAAIIATIAIEAPNFDAYEEPAAPFNTTKDAFDRYEGRLALGNTEPGDGARFRGRGYLGLTGRANYRSASATLGLGTRLIDSPDDAKSPEVAARVICGYFIERLPRMRDALERNDLSVVRKLVVGAPTELQRFSDYYTKLLARL